MEESTPRLITSKHKNKHNKINNNENSKKYEKHAVIKKINSPSYIVFTPCN